MAYGGVWATIFICHLIFGGHLLNIPKDISTEIFSKCYQPANSYTKSCELVGFFVSFPLLYSSEKTGACCISVISTQIKL